MLHFKLDIKTLPTSCAVHYFKDLLSQHRFLEDAHVVRVLKNYMLRIRNSFSQR